MPESRWKGYIKDYNGSTMMQCSIDRHITHETLYQDIKRQNEVSALLTLQHILQMIIKQHYCLLQWPGLNFDDPE